MQLLRRVMGSSAVSESVEVKKVSLLDLMQERTKENAAFSQLTHGTLKWMGKAIDTYGLKSDHPFAQKVMQALTKTRAQVKRFHHTDMNAESDDTMVRQGLLNNKEMLTKVKAEGATWTALQLNNLDDELLEAVTSTCTNLETFRVVARQDAEFMHLTDKSFSMIVNLKKLTRFEFTAWNAMFITFDTLLASPTFKSQLVELTLMSPQVPDSAIPVISQYTALKKLSIWACLSGDGLAAITVPKTVTHLSILISQAFPGAVITDALLAKIAQCPGITSLSLGGFSNNTDVGATAMINALSNLNCFSWQDYTLSTAAFLSLPNTLTEVNIGDCSLITSDTFDTFLTAKTKLLSVTFQNANGFTDSQIKSLPPIKHFFVESNNFLHLNGFPTSIEYFGLSGLSWINPFAFKGLANLPLKTLRLIGCDTFNNEAFHSLMSGSLATTLVTVEFYNAAITPKTIGIFEQMSELRNLMFGQCYSLGLEGANEIFKSNTLASRVTHLYLDGASIHKEMVPYLDNWEKLRVLYIWNVLDFPFKQEVEFGHIIPLKKHNGLCIFGGGEPFAFNDVIHAI